MSLKSIDIDSAISGQVILIVEDDIPEQHKYREYALQLGMTPFTATSRNEAFRLIDEQSIDYACCDLHLSTETGRDVPYGLDVIARIRDIQKQAIIVAMSSDPRRDISDKALTAGAQHFQRKPILSIEDFKIGLRLASQRQTLLKNQAQRNRSGTELEIFKKYPEGVVISQETRRVLGKLARRPDVYLNLAGETGTGKEEIAKIYHACRVSNEGPLPFVAVNCAQLNPSIADSELFGHKKGAFTGANENTIGYIGEAQGGILFLDEIHAMESQVQAKLLRVLNDGSYTRVGDVRPRSARFQLITASTRDLEEEAISGRFSMDLKMRIDGYPLHLPALRDRLVDIPDLLRLALARNQKSLSDTKIDEISKVLCTFHWSGNIRQFFKITNAWILHCDIYDLPLEPKHIPV
ncbi:MAG: sigma 54-interacting transcriptional regulator, partial [Pseudobdellovibrionaceae bacterium]|nr:sigma 54-interacting transcriptional regulator [Pseudobdellovibrionaceae bacterium]